MPPHRQLTTDEVTDRLKDYPGWHLVQGKLHRDLQFPDFIAAFAFMTQVALVAETMNHHPEWSNVYNRVTIDLTTHDVAGISDKDFALAARIDEFAP
jgi:4a-hydroxytetrahydrobiopterin dehydratase